MRETYDIDTIKIHHPMHNVMILVLLSNLFLLQSISCTNTSIQGLAMSTSPVSKVRRLSGTSPWRGWIVGRLSLGGGGGGGGGNSRKNDDQPKKDNHKPPSTVQMDPNLLESTKGSAYYYHKKNNDCHEYQYRTRRILRSQKDQSLSSLTTGLQTTIEVYLSRQTTQTQLKEYDKEQSLFLHMDRDASEPFGKTLKRMQLSIAKKIGSGKQSKQKKGKEARKNQSTDDIVPTLWKVQTCSHGDESCHCHEMLVEQVDAMQLSNQDLWTEGQGQSYVVLLPRQLFDPESDESDRSKEDDVPLWLEACPPTIVGVQTFEDFDACLFVGVPIVVKADVLYANVCRIDWYIRRKESQDPIRICHDCNFYVPTEEDVDGRLFVLLTPLVTSEASAENCDAEIVDDGRGREESYEFRRTVQPRPENTILDVRSKPEGWTTELTMEELVKRTLHQASTKEAEPFRVVTYNILADQNAFQMGTGLPFFPYVSKEVLSRQRRMPLLLHELLSYKADIMCLQEVDELVFETLLQPSLSEFGYQGYFACKIREGTREGCAIFWSTARFHEVSDDNCKIHALRDLLPNSDAELDKGSDWWDSGLKDVVKLLELRPDLRQTFLSDLGHVVQMVPLVDRQNRQNTIWVVNTHLFYHPQASHIRLLQMFLLAWQLSKEMKESSRASVIICGDFNSSLRNAAGKLLSDRSVPQNFRDLKDHLNFFVHEKPVFFENEEKEQGSVGTDQKDKKLARRDDDFPSISLPESFPPLVPTMSEPIFTHLIDGFSGALDHILVSSSSLECIGSAPLPTIPDVTKEVAMPSSTIPSDHVSLVSDLVVRRQSS